ncbi:porin [Pandoraea pulmonicola]|uniref:Porin n=1 Tax=Pandoraea pulmonicola TaxID=93221 RepID=A0AAJ5D2F9_PANPU|nr:porin [Pandoraea pulmonicola]AJC22882.1 porin [Pandoraea pulmonicola]SUA92798.1 Outer membrane porin protein BP0840 precursor [Pandoraea pulmonicola]
MKLLNILIGSVIVLTTRHAIAGNMTLFGLIDAGITYENNVGGKSSARFVDGIVVPNIFGIRGDENLGGGTRVVFSLVGQFGLGSGATVPEPDAIFGREAYVGISDNQFGRVTMGQQYDFMTDSLTFARVDGGILFAGAYNFRQGPFSKLAIPGNPTGSFDFDRMGGSARVSNSVKYTSPDIRGLQFGALYGFGKSSGGAPEGHTVSLGAKYGNGPMMVGAAFVVIKYPLANGSSTLVRSWGIGANYQLGDVLPFVLYTSTRNTLNRAQIDIFEIGADYKFGGAWAFGADFQIMSGNAYLNHNRGSQLTAALRYSLSKLTDLYMENVHQVASGDGGGVNAWIIGVPEASLSNKQWLLRIGMVTRF